MSCSASAQRERGRVPGHRGPAGADPATGSRSDSGHRTPGFRGGPPCAQAFGQDAYETLPLKAAALLHSIVRNHALVDGNKRLGWLATAVFLDLNGHAPDLEDDAAFGLVMDVAAGGVDVEAIASRLRVVPR